ncbi:hypothetical protein BD289DRAFT_395011, partial [Coniella lustricola]
APTQFPLSLRFFSSLSCFLSWFSVSSRFFSLSFFFFFFSSLHTGTSHTWASFLSSDPNLTALSSSRLVLSRSLFLCPWPFSKATARSFPSSAREIQSRPLLVAVEKPNWRDPTREDGLSQPCYAGSQPLDFTLFP